MINTILIGIIFVAEVYTIRFVMMVLIAIGEWWENR